MLSTVKNIAVNYEPINENNTFTNGDYVTGQVILEVNKDCRIDSLSIKFKGKSEVQWSERHGDYSITYRSKEKYFSTTRYFIRENKKTGRNEEPLLTQQNGTSYSNVVPPGCHVYPFSFQIPAQSMPSSFKGNHGKILYTLDTKLSRFMRMPSKASTKINFVSAVDPQAVPILMHHAHLLGLQIFVNMMPQYATKEKKMKVFTRGSVSMDVDLEKTGYFPGEGIKVVAVIQNNSSREVKPKYCVYSKHSFFANGKRKVDTKDLFKEIGEPIPPSTIQTITRILSIPHDVEPAILNSHIIKVEYRLRVYLDVKFALDPVLKFPIIFLPASSMSKAYSAPAHDGTSNNQPGNPIGQSAFCAAPQWPMAPQPAQPPPPYDMHEMFPSVNAFDHK